MKQKYNLFKKKILRKLFIALIELILLQKEILQNKKNPVQVYLKVSGIIDSSKLLKIRRTLLYQNIYGNC